jgi:hypothetical protein
MLSSSNRRQGKKWARQTSTQEVSVPLPSSLRRACKPSWHFTLCLSRETQLFLNLLPCSCAHVQRYLSSFMLYSSQDEFLRSASVRSNKQEVQTGLGGVSDKEACSFPTINIISRRQCFVSHCLSFFVGNDFGLHSICICFPSPCKLVTWSKRTV